MNSKLEELLTLPWLLKAKPNEEFLALVEPFLGKKALGQIRYARTNSLCASKKLSKNTTCSKKSSSESSLKLERRCCSRSRCGRQSPKVAFCKVCKRYLCIDAVNNCEA
eukprot:Pgem_evm1s10863